jgi:hypothetical protein
MTTPAKSGERGNDLQKQRADERAIKKGFSGRNAPEDPIHRILLSSLQNSVLFR